MSDRVQSDRKDDAMIESRAAVLRVVGEPLSVEWVTFDQPREGEVVVRMEWAGVCHSDLNRIAQQGTRVPLIIGHEGSGVVEQAGPGVHKLAVGDRVILSFIPSCGRCHQCTNGAPVACERGSSADGAHLDGTFRARSSDNLELGQMQRLGAFSERVVIHEDSCTSVEADADLRSAALLSCGFTTGAGSVINSARTEVGDTVVVVGVGGVGMAAVQGAVTAGASYVIAVDINDRKLQLARDLGATHQIDPREHDWTQEVKNITQGRGAERAVLCAGEPTGEMISQLVECLCVGGVAVIVGSAPRLQSIDVAPRALMWASKSIVGCLYGGMDPKREQRRWLQLMRAGRVKVAEMITAEYSLDEINVAISDMTAGRNIRGIINLQASGEEPGDLAAAEIA